MYIDRYGPNACCNSGVPSDKLVYGTNLKTFCPVCLEEVKSYEDFLGVKIF